MDERGGGGGGKIRFYRSRGESNNAIGTLTEEWGGV